MMVWFLFLFSLSQLQAEEQYFCPEMTFKTDFISPVTQSRRIFCTKRLSDGSLVQHGPEWIFDEDQKLKQTLYYQDGLITDQPPKPAHSTEEILGKDYGFMKTAIQEFLYLILPVKAPSRGTVFYGGFSTDRCYTSQVRQLDFYVKQTDKTLPLRPRFGEGCSLQGANTLLANQRTKIDFVAKLSHYFALEMMVRVNISKAQHELIAVEIVMDDARLTHPNGHLEFKAEYSLLMTQKMELREPHQGRLTILKESSKLVNQELPLKLQQAPTKL